MKPNFTIIAAGYKIIWLVYTVHYVIIFYIISSEAFSVPSAQISYIFLPLNIIINSTSLVLAAIGALFSYYASKSDQFFWNFLNRLIHMAMIAWIFGVSVWLFLIFI
jgi:hypothetical protein